MNVKYGVNEMTITNAIIVANFHYVQSVINKKRVAIPKIIACNLNEPFLKICLFVFARLFRQ